MFSKQVSVHKIKNRDIYNIDKKSYAMGLIRKAKVVISNLERVAYIMQDDSQEWAFLLEYITIDRGVLTPQTIFKGKKKQAEWARVMEDCVTNIIVSETR